MRNNHSPPLNAATLTAVQTLPILGPWPVSEGDVEFRNSSAERTENGAQRPRASENHAAHAHDDHAPARKSAANQSYAPANLDPDSPIANRLNGNALTNPAIFAVATADAALAAGLKLSTEQGFVAGPENDLAIEACNTLHDFLGTNYNPLLIFGLPGTGKSHIARGLAKAWQKRQDSSAEVLVYGGGEFVSAYHAATSQDRQREFQNRVQRAQLLVIDDLTQMAGKQTALLELKATMDELLANGGHVVITSRLPVEMIPGINSALLARLTGGLTITLKIPGPEARFVLWERYTAALGISAEPAILQSLATGLEFTAADIWQTILTLAASSATGRHITDRELKTILRQQQVAYRPTVRAIANLCAKYYGLKATELSSPVRRRTIVTARNMAIYLARTMSEVSLEQLGKHFGGRDHTTVLHGFRMMEERLTTEPETKQAYEDLRKMLAQR